MNKEERIVKDEIQVLLNHLGNKIEISFPLYEMNLLEARANEVGYNLKITAKRDLFDDELAVTETIKVNFRTSMIISSA